jgi:hypothetical protein
MSIPRQFINRMRNDVGARHIVASIGRCVLTSIHLVSMVIKSNHCDATMAMHHRTKT